MTPFLEGGRAGDGGDIDEGSGQDLEAAPPPAPIRQPPANTPIPALPPSRGKGKRYPAWAVTQARSLRRDMTLPEQRLWEALRKLERNFRRQVPVGPYVADFAVLPLHLIVELDGFLHNLPENHVRDAIRDRWLRLEGYRVLRFSNRQALEDLDSVLEVILGALEGQRQ